MDFCFTHSVLICLYRLHLCHREGDGDIKVEEERTGGEREGKLSVVAETGDQKARSATRLELGQSDLGMEH